VIGTQDRQGLCQVLSSGQHSRRVWSVGGASPLSLKAYLAHAPRHLRAVESDVFMRPRGGGPPLAITRSCLRWTHDRRLRRRVIAVPRLVVISTASTLQDLQGGRPG
jgi:hypothetical protein